MPGPFHYFQSSVCAIAFFAGILLSYSPDMVRAQEVEPVPHDRWLEIDLYWFDDTQIANSAEHFWNTYKPMFANVGGYRGVVLNLGMTVNYIMDYRGTPGQEILLPRGIGQELGAPIGGQLHGTTAQRQVAWRERYRDAANHDAQSGYGKWTYDKLRELANELRKQGAEAGINDFRVGSLIVGVDSAYGEQASFAREHPEAWTNWAVNAAGALASSSNFDPSARLTADPVPRAGLPNGIHEGMTVHTAFAAQWGAFSREVVLDALMLRDSMSFPRAFTRYGPYGEAVPDAGTAKRLTASLSALIRESKEANPAALIMMYSTGATATADWRANGIDLERIAGEGYLDIFVDQTWAGAWNEVGVRQQTFWNAPLLGWTYQQSYMMQHAAALAKSDVRHYFLTDTFDAWESWDTIHTAPERLRWGIWAYSHLAVKTPQGLRVPAGSYISWGNRGDALLAPDDVKFLTTELDAAARDAHNVDEVFGPTLVYSREVAAAQIDNLPDRSDIRDRIDEQLGSIIKWPVPVLSITRLEWLDDIESPLFIFGNTNLFSDQQVERIRTLAAGGQAMAFYGGFGTSTHPELLALAGASKEDHRPSIQDRSLQASLAAGTADMPMINFSSDFPIPPTLALNLAAEADTVYRVGNSAGLVRKYRDGLDIVAWDAPPLADYWFRPLVDNMNGSPAPYALAAAALTAQLADKDIVRAKHIDLNQTVSMAAWRDREGGVRVLLANLEEGLRDDADRARLVQLMLPESWASLEWESRWVKGTGSKIRLTDSIKITPQGSLLLISTQ